MPYFSRRETEILPVVEGEHVRALSETKFTNMARGDHGLLVVEDHCCTCRKFDP